MAFGTGIFHPALSISSSRKSLRLLYSPDLLREGFPFLQRADSRLLDGREYAEICHIQQLPVSLHQFGIAAEHREPGSAHGIGLGETVQFNAHVFGSRIRQKALPDFSVKHQLAVGIVVEHNDVVFFGKPHQLFVEFVTGDSAGGIVRIADVHQLHFIRIFNGVKIDQILIVCPQRHEPDLCPCQPGSRTVNRIVRIGDQDRVPGSQ